MNARGVAICRFERKGGLCVSKMKLKPPIVAMHVSPSEPRPFHLGGGGGHRYILGVEATGVERVVGEENGCTFRSSQAHDEGVIIAPKKPSRHAQ